MPLSNEANPIVPDKIVYTAQATSTGERNGLAQTDDGMVVRRLAFPIAMRGTGKGAHAEQLFAAGYAACFNWLRATQCQTD